MGTLYALFREGLAAGTAGWGIAGLSTVSVAVLPPLIGSLRPGWLRAASLTCFARFATAVAIGRSSFAVCPRAPPQRRHQIDNVGVVRRRRAGTLARVMPGNLGIQHGPQPRLVAVFDVRRIIFAGLPLDQHGREINHFRIEFEGSSVAKQILATVQIAILMQRVGDQAGAEGAYGDRVAPAAA